MTSLLDHLMAAGKPGAAGSGSAEVDSIMTGIRNRKKGDQR